MVEWIINNSSKHKPILEMVGRVSNNEPIEEYTSRYSVPGSELSDDFKTDVERYINEVLSYIDDDSSVLVFGSGHSYYSNSFFNLCENIKELSAVDFVEAASFGLNEDIDYYNTDILKQDLPGKYDYVFTSHTIEHFTRKEIMEVVLPRLKKAARKAVIIIVPYGDNWGGEPNHKCRFYEDDELAFMSNRYKIIRNGLELVYWLDT
jgi:hypothetical protein